jgi:pimeloyl-ACP methyl ester carboxylesterase
MDRVPMSQGSDASMNSALVGLLASAILGWSDISVSPNKGDRTLSAWEQSIAALDKPSSRTYETLRRYDLETRYRRDPEGALASLERTARQSPEAELVYALAEMSWIEGRRAEGRRIGFKRGRGPLHYYVDTVAYAYDYLFDPTLATGRRTIDPRYRLACDLYNGALDRLLRAAKAQGKLQPGGAIHIKMGGAEHVFRLTLERATQWQPSDVHELLLASDFTVEGLDSVSPQYGLGVPMIGVRRADQSNTKQARELDKFYPPEMAFPLTAVLRPTKSLREVVDPDAVRECTIDLMDPVQTRAEGNGADAIGLEADLTTPLAYMWSRTDLSRYRWSGLFRPGEAAGRAGLMLLRPYEPDKIPVVMVHGLASSPLAWIPMLNELLRDPKIHEKYQFFLYVYPTGVPVPIAAAGLSSALQDAQRLFDVEGITPAREFQQMVLLGHSMGGLLSHFMTVSSGAKLWELYSDKGFDEIVGPPEMLLALKQFCFFEPLPFVKRVVFLATPHRGAELSRRLVGRVVSNGISEPDDVHKLLTVLVKDNPDAFNARKFRHMPTSIDTLDPNSEVLHALLSMTPGASIVYHSIIGSLNPDGVRRTTDGVVPYSSAHLDGPNVKSEKVVRSDHGVQKDRSAIREVRRILLEHIGVPSAVAVKADEPISDQTR